jgi:hypothetical protein
MPFCNMLGIDKNKVYGLYSIVPYGTVQYRTVTYRTVKVGSLGNSSLAVPYLYRTGTGLHGTVPYGTVRYSTLQDHYSIVPYGALSIRYRNDLPKKLTVLLLAS